MQHINPGTHQEINNIICWESSCQGFVCSSQLNQSNQFGVLFNEQSCASILKWNEFLLEKVRNIISNIVTKGYSSFFVLRLDSSFPRNLITQISRVEIEKVALQILKAYEQTILKNINYMTNAPTINDLNVPEFLKDLYKYFIYDANHNLQFLVDDLQKNMRSAYPEKKIYDFTYFLFSGKQISQFQTKRRSLIKDIEDEVIIKPSDIQESYSPSMKKRQKKVENNEGGLNLMDISSFILSFQLNNVEQQEKPAEQKSGNRIGTNQPSEMQKQINILQMQNLMLRNQLQEKKQQLNFKQKSICELNKLINNEQEELLYRENQVELLTSQIKKLIDYKEKYEIMEKKLQEERKIIDFKDKNIKELNNVINNQQEELAYRESEVQGLMSDLKKIILAKNTAEQQIKSFQLKQQSLNDKISALIHQNQKLKSVLKRVENYEGNQTAWDDLMVQVIELQASVVLKDKQLLILIQTVQQLIQFAPQQKHDSYNQTINHLKDLALKK